MGYFDQQIPKGMPLQDELSGDPIGIPKNMMMHSDLEIGEIARFVSSSMNEIARLGKYDIEEVGFCLKLGCNEMEFTVKIKKDIPIA